MVWPSLSRFTEIVSKTNKAQGGWSCYCLPFTLFCNYLSVYPISEHFVLNVTNCYGKEQVGPAPGLGHNSPD